MTVEQPVPGIVRVVLDRPAVLNALDAAMATELHACCDELARDPSARVVILTGAGRGFCSGFDLSSPDLLTDDDGAAPARELAAQEHLASLVLRLRALPQPVIAAVNGAAYGAGLGLAIGADLRVAGASAAFSAAFIRVGVYGTDVGTTYLLPRLVGLGRAFDLLLTGRTVDATEAERIGLVNEVVADDALAARALELAQALLAHDELALRLTKQGIWAATEIGSLAAAMELENRTQVLGVLTGARDEAARAFRARRSAT